MKRTLIKYDKVFKDTVVKLLESGKISSIEEAKRKFNIRGSNTISDWCRSSKPELLPKLKMRRLKDEVEYLRDKDPKLYEAIKSIMIEVQ